MDSPVRVIITDEKIINLGCYGLSNSVVNNSNQIVTHLLNIANKFI